MTITRLTVKKNNNHNYNRIGLFIAVLTAVVALSYYLFTSSMVSNIRSSSQTLNQLGSEIEELEDLLSGGSQLKAVWLEVEKEYEGLKYFLPPDEELSAVMADLDFLLQPYSNNIISLTAGDINHSEEFTILNCRLLASGGSARLQVLLDDLENFIYRPVIGLIIWQETDSHQATLEIEFKMYFDRYN